MMTSPSHAHHPVNESALFEARVRLLEGDKLSVSTADGDLVARRAASCLLAPQPGDLVLVSAAPRPFVLAVLERHDPDAPAELSTEGDLRVVARGGRLEMAADAVSILSRQELEMTAQRVSLRSSHVELFSKLVTAVTAEARLSSDRLALLAQTCDVFAERVTQRASRVYRFVSEIDQLRARHFDYRAEHSAQIKGENTVMVARQVAKIDGEQIHVG